MPRSFPSVYKTFLFDFLLFCQLVYAGSFHFWVIKALVYYLAEDGVSLLKNTPFLINLARPNYGG